MTLATKIDLSLAICTTVFKRTCHDFLGITVTIIPDYSPRNLVDILRTNLLTLTFNDLFSKTKYLYKKIATIFTA